MRTFGRPNSARASEPSMFDLMTWSQSGKQNSESRDNYKIHQIQQKTQEQQEKQNFTKNELIQHLNINQDKKAIKFIDEKQAKQYHHETVQQKQQIEENIENLIQDDDNDDTKINDENLLQKQYTKQNKSNLNSSKNKLDSSKNKLNSSKNKLSSSKNKLNSSKNKLDSSKNKLQNKTNQQMQQQKITKQSKIIQLKVKPPIPQMPQQQIAQKQYLQKKPQQQIQMQQPIWNSRKSSKTATRPQSAQGKKEIKISQEYIEKTEKELDDPKWKRDKFIALINEKKVKNNLLSKKINHVIPIDSNITDKINDFNLIELNPQNYKKLDNASDWLEKIPYAGKSQRQSIRPSMNQILYG